MDTSIVHNKRTLIKGESFVKETRKASMGIALIPVVFLVVSLISTLQFLGR